MLLPESVHAPCPQRGLYMEANALKSSNETNFVLHYKIALPERFIEKSIDASGPEAQPEISRGWSEERTKPPECHKTKQAMSPGRGGRNAQIVLCQSGKGFDKLMV